MEDSETPSLQQQAERLGEWRDGFQAVHVIATGDSMWLKSGAGDGAAPEPHARR